MGSETRKAQCTTLYVCDSNKEKCSKRLRSILGILPCLILRIWRLWAWTKIEYTMDDFSSLTIREPWLLKRKVSTSTVSTWLAGKGIDATRSSRLAARGQVGRSFQDHYEEKEWLIQEFQNFLVRQMTLCGNFRLILLTPLLISQIWGFDNSLFWKCNTFQSWYDAYACAVWCSWCTLEWIGYPYDELVIPKTIKGRGGFEWRVAFSQPRYLARS
jgi:hypothetical protein